MKFKFGFKSYTSSDSFSVKADTQAVELKAKIEASEAQKKQSVSK
jgi:hypothetical protein